MTPCFCRHARVFASSWKKPRRPPEPCCWLALAVELEADDEPPPHAVRPRVARRAQAQAIRRAPRGVSRT
jgi:hypothetical protein